LTCHGDAAFGLAAIADCVRCIDHEVEHNLIEFALTAQHRRQTVFQRQFEFGIVLPFTPTNRRRSFDDRVQRDRQFLFGLRMRKFLHRQNDPGYLGNAIEGLLRGVDRFTEQVFRVRAFLLLFQRRHFRRYAFRLANLAYNRLIAVDKLFQIIETIGEKSEIIADILDWRVDFMCDAAGQRTKRFHLRRLDQLHLRILQIGQRLLQFLIGLVELTALRFEQLLRCLPGFPLPLQLPL